MLTHRLRANCRGGSQPPAQYKPTVRTHVGRIRTVLNMVPFNQILRLPTWREAESLPYSGWVIGSAGWVVELRNLAELRHGGDSTVAAGGDAGGLVGKGGDFRQPGQGQGVQILLHKLG